MERLLQQDPIRTPNERGNGHGTFVEQEDDFGDTLVGHSKSSKEGDNVSMPTADGLTLESGGYTELNGSSHTESGLNITHQISGSAQEQALLQHGDGYQLPKHDDLHSIVYFDQVQGFGLNGNAVADDNGANGENSNFDNRADLRLETFPQVSEIVTGGSHKQSNGIYQTETSEDQEGKNFDVIEELAEENVDYDVEKVIEKQETHDLFCPNCHSCITKRVVVKRRKRKIHEPSSKAKRERLEKLNQVDPEANLTDRSRDVVRNNIISNDGTPADSGIDSESKDFFRCLSCFTIFFPTGNGFKLFKISKDLNQTGEIMISEPAKRADTTWFSLFKSNKKSAAMEEGFHGDQAGANISQNNRPDQLDMSSKAKPISHAEDLSLLQDQGGTIGSLSGKDEVSSGAGKVPILRGVVVEANTWKQTEISKKTYVYTGDKHHTRNGESFSKESSSNGASEDSAGDGEESPNQGKLSPILQSSGVTTVSTVTVNANKVIDTGLTGKWVSLREETKPAAQEKMNISTRNLSTGDRMVVQVDPETGYAERQGVQSNVPSESDHLLPITTGAHDGRRNNEGGEGHPLEILKSIVYGGLVESITSLGVVSSAAGSGATTLNILVLGMANLIGGLIVVFHNLREVIKDEVGRTDENQPNIRYHELLGRRENFRIHAMVVILSYLFFGLIPPIVYGFSFRETNNRDYKAIAVLVTSLACIFLLSVAKARVRTPRKSYFKTAAYYLTIGVASSGVSYIVGDFVVDLVRDLHWFDPTEGASMAGKLLSRAGPAGLGFSTF